MIFYDVIILLILLVGVIFALRTLKLVVKYEFWMKNMASHKNVILFFTWGILFLFLAQLGKLFFASAEIIPRFIPQIILLLAHFLLILAFASFWYNTAKMHRLSPRDRLFFFGLLSFLLLGVFMLIYNYLDTLNIFGAYGFFSALNLCLTALAFLCTYAVQPRIKAGISDSSLKYFSSGIFVYFLAKMLEFYIQFGSGPTWLEGVYTLLTLIILVYIAAGFMAIHNRCSRASVFKSNVYKL